MFDLAVSLYLAVSAIVLGTGLFILLRGVVDVFVIAPLLLLLANMLVALSFAYRVIREKWRCWPVAGQAVCQPHLRGWRRSGWSLSGAGMAWFCCRSRRGAFAG